MSDIKKAISALRRASERFNQEISKAFERFNQGISKALSSLEKATVPSSTQTMLTGRPDLKTSIQRLFERQKSMTLKDIQKAHRTGTLTELKPSVEELVKEGILRVDEATLGGGRKIIGRTNLLAGRLTPSVKAIISDSKFLDISKEEYNRLAPTSAVAPHVEIEQLRNRVTERLDITSNEFDRLLLKLHSENPVRVQLEPGTGKSGRGIVTPRGVCYFVIIR